MAKVINGFLGDAIGKIGNVIFRKWNALITASQYQPNVKDPNTPKQQIQRIKIKYLSLLMQPFKDSFIPLNFKNRKGLSTSWAEAIKANYPLIDEMGNIEFKDGILSGGTLMPPTILSVNYDPFINLLMINYKLVNEAEIDLSRVRLSGTGKMFLENAFDVSNICKLPVENTFITYIDELDPPDWPLYYNFNSAWSEGKLFYNLVKSPGLDVRGYNPRNIINQASAGANFQLIPDEYKIDFNITNRIIMPEQIHASIIQNEAVYSLKINIDNYSGIPGLLPDDEIIVVPRVIDKNANKYGGSYHFPASTGEVTIPLLPGDETKPFLFIYLVTDVNGTFKSTVTRFDFNLPATLSYCELLFVNDLIHPDSIKIHKLYTAIWGDLKDFIPLELVPTIPYKIFSKNVSTGEEREHVFNSQNMFLCSKLLRNQLYNITISDGTNPVHEFSVIGIDNNYAMTGEYTSVNGLIKFKASYDLCMKVK